MFSRTELTLMAAAFIFGFGTFVVLGGWVFAIQAALICIGVGLFFGLLM